jgi:Tol biopolymer transport system component
MTFRLRVTVVVGVAAVAGAFGLAGAAAPLPGSLVFASNDGYGSRLEIAVAKPDGSGYRRLTHHEPTGSASYWTTDGRSIVVLGNDDEFTYRPARYWRMRADGTHITRIGIAGDEPSPSGRLLVRATPRGVEVRTAAGRFVRLLRRRLRASEVYDGGAAWSPDDRLLAYGIADEDRDTLRVFVARIDGRRPVRPVTKAVPGRYSYPLGWSPGGRTLLAKDGPVVTIAADGSGRHAVAMNPEGSFAWSPDGRTIAFVGRKGGIFFTDARTGRGRRIAVTDYRGSASRYLGLDWSPQGKALVVGDQGGIYILSRSGKSRRRISRFGSFPLWAPRGSRIAFDGPGRSVYTVNSRGRGLKRLLDTDSDDDPEWSPDRTKIAFIRGDHALSDPARIRVYVMNASGGDLHPLGIGYDHEWAPDGNSVVFVHRLGLDPPDVYSLGRGEITIALADGTKRVVAVGAKPTWSPDGKHIAFLRYEFNEKHAPIRSTLLEVAADGTGERTIATASLGVDEAEPLFYSPKWSPNGTQIAAQLWPIGDPDSGEAFTRLIVVDPASGALTSLVDMVTSFAWSPDGKRIAVTRTKDYQARRMPDVAVLDADGTHLEVLRTLQSPLTSDSWLQNVTWSPDGAAVAMIKCWEPSEELHNCDIERVGLADRKVIRVTRTPGVEGALHWSGSPPGRR